MRGRNPQCSIKMKTRDQMQNSADLLISSFWLLCCLLSVMRIMFSVRTEVKHFHTILKWKMLQNTTVLCISCLGVRNISYFMFLSLLP